VSFLVLSGGALAIFRPAWASTVGLDVWNLPDLDREMASERRRAEVLDAKGEIVRLRSVKKAHVVREVLAGRMTLLEGAADFRTVNSDPPDFPGTLPSNIPGRTENERYCRLVLERVKRASQDLAPSHADEILRQLEKELETHLAEHGGVVILPGYEAEANQPESSTTWAVARPAAPAQ
jgi:hypothetical protein